MTQKLDIQQKKSSNQYMTVDLKGGVKDVDLSKRTVTGLFNSYFFIDSDFDMLIPGASTKSINERGVGSTKGNKIKHLKDHSWNDNIARIDVLEEKKVSIDGQSIEGIYHESFYPNASDSNDMLIKIQEGLYDARSIGYRYEKIDLAEKESVNEDYQRNWEKFYPMALNPEKADEFGFFYVVKEIRLFEGSDVVFGANSLTPMIEVKGSENKHWIDYIENKLTIIRNLFKNGKGISDEGFYQMQMEQMQLETYLKRIKKQALEPSLKDTFKQSRLNDDTQQSSIIDFYKNLK